LLGDIGTIEWCRRTNGILGRGERARFLAAMTWTMASGTPRLLAAKAGKRGGGPDPSRLTPPDSPFARDVVEACAELDPMVVEHGYRSYLFARALGIAEDIACDDEALFAATMLHDYAFETMDTISGKCFTLVGAEVAAELLARSELEPSTQHDVLDAITLHLNPSVRREQGDVQYLTHEGIIADVIGIRSWELDRDGMTRVAERHPRHGFTVRGEPLLRTHAHRVPGCRAGALLRAGFGPALKLSMWRASDRASAMVSSPA
jgi:hypothetical protein